MKYICDFHIHSKYSRATSKEMDVLTINKWAKIKGIQIVGTGDFTHPLWLQELKENLEPAEPGLYKIKTRKQNNGLDFKIGNSNTFSEPRFILTVEISNIYSKKGKVRKIHNIIFAPDFETVEKINTQLGWIGNLKADGRPILGLDAKELVKIVLSVSPDCLVVPAHAWTPWFSVFGANSGFDSLEECFEEYTKYIYAIETGLSSDPPMNWRLSALDNITLISNSDAHSPSKLGREANIFEGEKINYKLIIEAIKKGAKIDKKAISQQENALQLIQTIEFFPEEGKYHFDGHRNCGVCFSPEESKKHNNICPKCGKPLTIGVMHRVCELADRNPGETPASAIPYKRLIPLEEIIADVLKIGTGTKQVIEIYKRLIKTIGPEFKVLLEAKKENLLAASSPEIAEAIIRVREGKVNLKPGFDGEFGKISIFSEEELGGIKGGQESLF
ncbi:DNA helicase UvrD [bacterium]|nr:DNA helicase UvrD [bacterium]